MATAAAALPAVPTEVREFLKKEGAEAYLQPVLEMVRQLVPSSPLNVKLEIDPEIPKHCYVCIEADLTDVEDEDSLFELDQRWTEELFRVCPPTHVWLFHFRML
jgi:hypothetical protein